MPLEPESDLAWAAFLYICGELTPDDEAAFERRLAEDQDAREAVAGAVELAGALALAVPEHVLTLPPKRSPGRRRVFALVGSLAAAACVALAAISALQSHRPAETDASDVALAWSDLRGGADPDWLAIVAASSSQESPDPVPNQEHAVEDEASTDRALPSWLLMAASAPRTSDAPPKQEEN